MRKTQWTLPWKCRGRSDLLYTNSTGNRGKYIFNNGIWKHGELFVCQGFSQNLKSQNSMTK